jgi:2-polyprenyl-3-methyl-5-hydroxy-6-metoxy-1,4-benzoquinol methylase
MKKTKKTDSFVESLENSPFHRISITNTENHHVAIDLQTLHEARNYRGWLYSHIKEGLGHRIIEIGSGIGNYTEMLLSHGEVWATDMEEEYVQFLGERFAGRNNFRVGKLVLGNWDSEMYKTVGSFKPDTFVCMNVIEHIENDVQVMKDMISCLTIDGQVIVIVPALPWLYSNLDKKYGHFRRYTKSSVLDMVSQLQGAEMVHCQYFNLPGVFGWWFNNVLLKRELLPKGQTKIFDKYIVPVMKGLENIIVPFFGLSLVFWIRRIK